MTNADSLRRTLFILLSLSLTLVLGGCSLLPGQDTAAQTEADRATRTAAIFPTSTASPPPASTATPTPEPTPILPAAVINSQALGEDAVLTVDSVALPEAGWLAIFTVPDGGNETLAGAVPLEAGVHEGIRVPLQPQGLTSTLIARLYWERVNPETLDYPGPDEPVADNFGVPFDVDLTALQPSVVVEDQAVGEDGIVQVKDVYTTVPSWLLIHAGADGPDGPVLGKLFLEPGRYSDLALSINWREATPMLYAVLHEDSGRPGLLDYPEGDLPLLAGDGPALDDFNATYPPAILVYDQPLLTGRVVVDRAISDGSGWLVVQADDGTGQPGLIIGSAAVEPGLNERVAVEVMESDATPQLFVRLHEDTTPGDEFNFPNADPPIRYEGRLPKAASFRTDTDSYVIVDDQRLEDDRITVALVVAMQDGWVAIHTQEDGEAGDVLGQTWVPAGINRNVGVEVDPALATGTLLAMLHQDRGQPKEFEYPTGNDTPLVDNREAIAAPFSILPSPVDSAPAD